MQSVRRSRKDSTRSRPTSMALFGMKTSLSLETKMKTKMWLLRFMTGKLLGHLAWIHRHLRAHHYNAILETTGLALISTSPLSPLTAPLEDISFDQTIHY